MSYKINELIRQLEKGSGGTSGSRAMSRRNIINFAKQKLDNIILEIKKNATEDTLFERMVIYRLEAFKKEYFGEEK